MLHLVLKCPHCDAENMNFMFRGECPLDSRPSVKVWTTFFVCTNCLKGIVVELVDIHHSRAKLGNPSSCSGNAEKIDFRIQKIYPVRQSIEAPEFTPDDLKKDYVHAETQLRRKEFNSVGMTLRRVLERSTKRLLSKEASKNTSIRERIELLERQRKITPDLCDLANVIRDDGNAATHDEEELDENTATRMRDFTKLFLEATFTWPERINQVRQDKQGVQADPATST